MLISTTKLTKFDNEFVVEFKGYRFAYICFKRNTKLEHILRNVVVLSERHAMTTSYRFKMDTFINSIHGFKEIVTEEIKIYTKNNNINKMKGRIIYGTYDDLFYLKTEDVKEILSKSILRQEGIDIWKLRVSSNYISEK